MKRYEKLASSKQPLPQVMIDQLIKIRSAEYNVFKRSTDFSEQDWINNRHRNGYMNKSNNGEHEEDAVDEKAPLTGYQEF